MSKITPCAHQIPSAIYTQNWITVHLHMYVHSSIAMYHSILAMATVYCHCAMWSLAQWHVAMYYNMYT